MTNRGANLENLARVAMVSPDLFASAEPRARGLTTWIVAVLVGAGFATATMLAGLGA